MNNIPLNEWISELRQHELAKKLEGDDAHAEYTSSIHYLPVKIVKGDLIINDIKFLERNGFDGHIRIKVYNKKSGHHVHFRAQYNNDKSPHYRFFFKMFMHNKKNNHYTWFLTDNPKV